MNFQIILIIMVILFLSFIQPIQPYSSLFFPLGIEYNGKLCYLSTNYLN